MRIIILKTNKVETACDLQEDNCQGINCKTCQFNKIGVDVEYLKNNIYTSILYFLNSNKDKTNNYDKSEELSKIIIDVLLKEESDQEKIGFHIFEKIIH